MKTVFVVGAGPAGMFAAQKIALGGHQVMIFNRDIKPGGLAEYGIYPMKEKMKSGLRKQFAKVLALPNVHYFGHVPVGNAQVVPLGELYDYGPAATVFAIGAQGTKKLGLPGEGARGVYSAKDFVYFYNQLPPFASQDFSTGKRIAVIGMGNVAVDIVRWLLQDAPNKQTEEVIIVARRGPFEAKFDEKEFAHVQMHLDRKDFQDELNRVKDKITGVGQDISQVAESTFPCLTKFPNQETVLPKLSFRFLSSPAAIQAGSDGRIERLTITENQLVAKDGGTAAKATDKTIELDVDTMIFAIGDVADPTVGLPYEKGGYVTKPDPGVENTLYEVFDPANGTVMAGTYVVGWARKASEGLVGIARHDAEVGAAQVLKYLETVSSGSALSVEQVLDKLHRKSLQVVAKPELALLGKVEERIAQERGVPSFKFGDNKLMLAAIEEERSKSKMAACCS